MIFLILLVIIYLLMSNITLTKLKTLNDKDPTIFNNDQRNTINKYYEQSKEDWCLDHFYLGGQLELHIDIEITTNHIQEVMDINKKKHEIVPCNSIELYKFESAINNFNHFVCAFNHVISKEIELN